MPDVVGQRQGVAQPTNLAEFFTEIRRLGNGFIVAQQSPCNPATTCCVPGSMRYRRTAVAGASYFFTVVTFERRPILTLENHPELIRAALLAVKRERPFQIEAFVLLADHLHCIWTLPPGDRDFATRWSLVKTYFTRRCSCRDQVQPDRSRTAKHERAIWQRRYWEHLLRDDLDFERHCDYIHYNPVKHGHVRAPGDWAYSSFARFVRDGRYPPDWGSSAVSIESSVGRE